MILALFLIQFLADGSSNWTARTGQSSTTSSPFSTSKLHHTWTHWPFCPYTNIIYSLTGKSHPHTTQHQPPTLWPSIQLHSKSQCNTPPAECRHVACYQCILYASITPLLNLYRLCALSTDKLPRHICVLITVQHSTSESRWVVAMAYFVNQSQFNTSLQALK